jgi:ubiquitin-conjugating enzyme E2 D/E
MYTPLALPSISNPPT